MGLNAAASHPTTQLVKLRQAEAMGILDQNRVDAGDVETALHNRGAEHHIRFPAVERHHGALQFALGHLAMGHQQPQTGKHLAQLTGHLLDALHPRHHVKHLAAAVELLTDGTANGLLIQGCEVGFDRPTQGWRRGDQAHLPHPGQAHVERAGNRRGREGQYIHVLAQCLDLLLLIHTEALFFIHHQQSELVEDGVLAQQLVGAHHRIDRAVLQTLQNRLALTGSAEPVEQRHLDRIGRKPLGQRAPVLLREHRRGSQHGHLLASGDRLENRPDRHFGLAEAHIAAHQTIHRLRLLHVALHIGRGLQLIGRGFVGE